MDEKKADPATESALVKSPANNNTSFRFCSGNAGIIQRRIILCLLDLIDNQGFEQLPQADKLALAGTDAIRKLAQPFKNPLEYISQLRALNGDGCLWSMDANSERLSHYGRSPAYYYIPLYCRKTWRDALQASCKGGGE